ncbi:MAG: hypothetical protein ACRDNT_23580 [Streptosporangiaceae bacterium]
MTRGRVRAAAERRGLARFRSEQPTYSILNRGIEREVKLDDLLASVDVALTDDILDRIDKIVPPGTDVGAPDQSAHVPPALQRADLRRRPASERAAA